MKCSHREDAVEKCTKKGDWYESFHCPRPKSDPTLICQLGRWYFSDKHPHEVEMAALRTIDSFGAMHGFSFTLEDMKQEIFENYLKVGNKWAATDWGIMGLEAAKNPQGFRLPLCMYEEQDYEQFEHQRPWWHNWKFPATCGNHGGNETADFVAALGIHPGSAKHVAGDQTFKDRVPRVSHSTSIILKPVLTFLDSLE